MAPVTMRMVAVFWESVQGTPGALLWGFRGIEREAGVKEVPGYNLLRVERRIVKKHMAGEL